MIFETGDGGNSRELGGAGLYGSMAAEYDRISVTSERMEDENLKRVQVGFGELNN